jgi:UDP-glucose 4-epimerase
VRVLVTGGSGFIGSHVVDQLLAAGLEPRIFDLMPSPHHEAGEVDAVIGDLLDTEVLQHAMDGCEAVIHLAAAADVEKVVEEPSDAEQTNAHGTLSLLEAARRGGVGRVIYGSTIWVYGESGENVLGEEAPLVLPRHIYTASKLAGEMYCASYAELYDVPFTILRFGIPYGPRARPSTVIAIFIRKALAGEPLTIAGDGMQTRRFVYVEDLAEGVVRALEPCAVNRVYNLAGDETVTIRELAETVQEHVGEVKIVHVPGRSGDFGGAEISSHRAEQELGWRASTSLREGVGRYLAWLNDTAPVAAQKTAPVEPASTAPAAAAAPAAAPGLPLAQRVRERLFAGVPIMGLACFFGTLLPYLLAHRMDEFDTSQADAVAVTTLFAILVCLSIWQAGSAGNARQGVMVVGWLVIGYVALFTVPWPSATPPLALPEIQTLIMSTIGTAIALTVVAGANRLRDAEAAAPDRLT